MASTFRSAKTLVVTSLSGLALAAALLVPAASQAAGVRCSYIPSGSATGNGCFDSQESCVAFAGNTCTCNPDDSCPGSSTTSGAVDSGRTQIQNPFGNGVTIEILIGRIIRIMLGISGSVALLMFVYGGFLWVTSAGSMEKVKSGKKILTQSVIGLVVIYGSYAILTAIFGALGANLG